MNSRCKTNGRMNVAWVTVCDIHFYEVWDRETKRKLKTFDAPEKATAWADRR